MAIQHKVKSRLSSRAMLYEKPSYFLIIKRSFDIILSSILIILFLPAFICISYQIFRREGRPIFHREAIVGTYNEPFIMWTFRIKTIPSQVIRSFPPRPVPGSWEDGVSNEFTIKKNGYQMITPTGNRLLKYKLYKLPLLVHILKGDMSFVGPQAEITEIAKHYNNYQKKRLEVKPGLTGYAQINQMTNKNHQRKIMYDLYYIKKLSFLLDVKILTHALKRTLKTLRL